VPLGVSTVGTQKWMYIALLQIPKYAQQPSAYWTNEIFLSYVEHPDNKIPYMCLISKRQINSRNSLIAKDMCQLGGDLTNCLFKFLFWGNLSSSRF
jgi:hypothetical protein